MKPRQEQMHENRHKRHAGPMNAGHKRKPTPADRDLRQEWEGDDPDLRTCPVCGRWAAARTTECRDGHPGEKNDG